MYRLKILSICLVIVFSLLFVFVGSKTETTEKMNSINFNDAEPSEFLNIFQNGYYTNQVTLRHYNDFNQQIFQVPENGEESINDTENKPFPRGIKNVGFKHNGQFYTDRLTLTETGYHKIEVYEYYDKEYATPDNPLESFFIIIDKENTMEGAINQKTFYYEHYSNPGDMIQDIQNNVRGFELSEQAKTDIRGFWKNNDKSNFSNSLNVELSLNDDFINIELKSIRTEGVEGEIFLNEKVNSAVLIDVSYSSNIDFNNDTIGNYCEDNIDLCFSGLELKTTKATQIMFDSVEFNSEQEIIQTSTSTDYYKTNGVEIKFSDNFNNLYNIERDVYFFRPTRIERKEINVDFSDLSFSKFETLNERTLAEGMTFYTEFMFGNKPVRRYYDPLFNEGNVTTHAFSNININRSGTYSVDLTFEDPYGNEEKTNYYVEITDEEGPKVLPKYNVIVLELDEDFVFENYFKVVDENDISFVNYTGFDENELYERGKTTINVESEDEFGNRTEKEFDIYLNLENELSFYEKNIQPFLYNIRSIFYGG